MTLLLLIVVALAALALAVDGAECTSSRPGWGDRRTLFVPEWMFANDNDVDEAWIEALCCVYTHVETTPSSSSSGRFELYDGSDYTIRGDSFEEIAFKAMDDICGMSMGSIDCQRREACVERAFETSSPTDSPRPTPRPTPNPTPTPTSEPPTLEPPARNSTNLLLNSLNCTSDRPGRADHRTLYVPEGMITVSNETMNSSEAMVAWIDALCCVYTHVEIVSPTMARDGRGARLKVYDGYMYTIPGSLLAEVASNAMEDICDMSMGSQDCRRQAECVDAAFMPSNVTNGSSAGSGRRAEHVYHTQEVWSSEAVQVLGTSSAALLACAVTSFSFY